jgi:SpoVK/Ycf46/Vps4 family AAA+-type ATPase
MKMDLSYCSLKVTDKNTGETCAEFTFSTPSLRILQIFEGMIDEAPPVNVDVDTKENVPFVKNLVLEKLKEAGIASKEVDFSLNGPRKRNIHKTWIKSEAYIQKVQDKVRKWNRPSRFDAMADLQYCVEAEIKATVAACLSTVHAEVGGPSKTNLILHCPAEGSEQFLPAVVHSIAADFRADVVSIDAQDLAELVGGYMGDTSDPVSQSIRLLGYDTYRMKSDLRESMEDMEGIEEALDEEDARESSPPSLGFPTGKPFSNGKGSVVPGAVHFINIDGFAKSPIFKALASGGLGNGRDRGVFANAMGGSNGRLPSQNEAQWEDIKLNAILEALVEANDTKRSRHGAKNSITNSTEPDAPKFFDQVPTILEQKSESTTGESSTGPRPLEVDLTQMLNTRAQESIELKFREKPLEGRIPTQLPSIPGRKKIILIQDIKELGGTQRGSQIITKLQEIVRKRRQGGENTMIIGTTSSTDLMPDISKAGVRSLQADTDNPESYSRTIVVPFYRDNSAQKRMLGGPFRAIRPDPKPSRNWAESSRNSEINLRHIQDMLRHLDPVVSRDLTDPERRNISLPFNTSEPNGYLDRVLSFDEVHRISLTAIGIHRSQQESTQLSPVHISLAMQLIDSSDDAKFSWVGSESKIRAKDGNASKDPPSDPTAQQSDSSKHDHIKAKANKHEKRLLGGVIDPEKINTTFADVHAPTETIESLRMLTSLSLLRPEAFKYGVLATDKIPGLLLYGPPGTGKTLLAKAVAKESGATVLEVSGSEVYDMYVGEGEKNVRAIFSLARKLSPCVVFIDEADAIFGSRDGGRQRTSHREIINQFLKEWDGMNDLSVFIMVATNRPFDLDDAVLRRLPRRLLVDLPTQADRKKILDIHLKGEVLGSDVNVPELAELTPLYSGSDLKNLAVAAALACVREENEHAAIAMAKAMSEASSTDATADSSSTKKSNMPSDRPPQLVPGMKYNFPEKRTLQKRHFEKAMQEISASISEDMSSLGAIKKFDEQFGDRRGRRKKSAYGFGMERGADEGAARVRKGG